jgi:hypothetical protein
MTDQSAIISEGREAWERIKERTKATFEDWMRIGRALIVGRTECMAKAKVNSPFGPAYQKHMRAWLDSNGLGDLDTHERTNAVHMIEHEAEITTWRNRLNPVARRLCNHPNSVMKHIKCGTVPQKTGPKVRPKRQVHTIERRVETKVVPTGPRLERPSGDLISRIATAMRTSGKSDWLVLASIAVQTITLDDLRDLMPAKMAPARAPALLEAAHA